MMDTEVHIGKIAVARGNENLTASGIGSCLVITLWNPKLKIGALAHTMLPNRRSSSVARDSSDELRIPSYESHLACRQAGDTRHVDVAIDEMIKQMETQGAHRADLEAKLIGGANMFSAFESDIGEENVLSAKDKLQDITKAFYVGADDYIIKPPTPEFLIKKIRLYLRLC